MNPRPRCQHRLLPLGLLSLAAVLLGACSSTPVAEPTPAVKSVAVAPTPPAEQRSGAVQKPVAASTVASKTLPPYLDPKSAISTGRSLFFDFDDALLKPEFTTLIERHGKYLIANPGLPIRIEGNTDERGSAEYNLALGQKRADAVRRALEVYGVKSAQISTSSWGREKPRSGGHDESAWAQNRRADLQYPSQ